MTRPLWRTKDGRTFPIDLMSDVHLNNAVLMLRRIGYVTSSEAGPMPHGEREAVAWASRPASTLLDALASERLHRIKTNAPPFDEAEAEEAQDNYLRGTTQFAGDY